MNHSLRQNPVAIIGMSGIFAGAENLDTFWENIVAQIDCITEVPPSRWDLNEYYDPDPKTPDKTYSKVGGFIPDIDFDPLEFGLPPNILEVTDTSQILALVMAKQALQDCKYVGERFTEQLRKNTGVILGVGGGQKLAGPLGHRLQEPIWKKVLPQYGLSEEAVEEAIEKIKAAYVPWQENAFPGFLSNVIAGRIANRFDLGGTNCTVDAACAASLSAIKMSINELVEHRCDMMITGGVDTDNSPMAYIGFSKTPAFSRKNRVRPFDAEADGIVIGEGIGMLVMRRLEDAERDGDPIYAVIRGIGSSSDGRHSSIYGPVSQGQQLAMKRAYDEAGYDPVTVGLLEAHGTGTPTGDRVEFHSISSTFKDEKNPNRKIALGSVKSQIGHTKTAAGSASLIKTAMALHHKVLPPTINITKPNPDFNYDEAPVYINTELRPWIQPENGTPRRASVSAFGFGGTNFHMTVEEYQPEHKEPYRRWSPFRTCILFANNYELLIQQCQQNLEATEKAKTFEPLPVPQSIPQNAPRIGFVYQSKKELEDRLKSALKLLKQNDAQKAWEHPQGVSYSPEGMAEGNKVAVLFSGQGAQYVNMGSKLACLYPEFRENFQRTDRIMQALYQEKVSDKVYPNPSFDPEEPKNQQKNLTQTQYAQPGIGTISMSMFNLLSKAGLQPDMMGGHSFGELTALWASGVLNEEDYIKLACLRGNVMAQAAKGGNAGGMLAVQADVDTVKRIIKDENLKLDLSNINAPDQVVLGGATVDVERAATVFADYKLFAKVLPVSAAFHTERLKEAQLPLAEAIGSTKFQNPKCSVYSNIDGKAYPAVGTMIQEKFKEHMLSSVQFQQEIETMYEDGARVFVEVGPRNILSNLLQSTLKNRNIKAIALNANPKLDSAQQYQLALTQLLVAGVSLNARDLYQVKSNLIENEKPKMSIRINATNYLSADTKKNWETALKGSSFKAKMPEPIKEEKLVEKTENKSISQNNGQAPSTSQQIMTSNTPSLNPVHLSLEIMQKQITLMEEMLKFQIQQKDAMDKHRMFLVTYKDQINQMFANEEGEHKDVLSAFQNAIAVSPDLSQGLVSLARSGNGNGHYASNGHATANGHVNGNVTSNGKAMVVEEEISNVADPVKPTEAQKPVAEPIVEKAVPAPVTAVQPVTVDPQKAAEYEKVVVDLIADKTGYPAEMLSQDMELVSDLGIDSIKQVEIFGAMREEYPELQQLQTEDFIQIKTLGDIILMLTQYLGAVDGNTVPAEISITSEPVNTSSAGPEPIAAEEEKAVAEAPKSDNDEEDAPDVAALVAEAFADPAKLETDYESELDTTEVAETLLEIIADKTGYPAEMLSEEMELVSDLGIDSIKQVEIFGAMREQYADSFVEVEPEQLMTLKTIKDVIELIHEGKKKSMLSR